MVSKENEVDTNRIWQQLMTVTPVEQLGEYWVKRDDKFQFAGVNGGKTRAATALCIRAINSGFTAVTTAGARKSPQCAIVAAVAKHLGLQCTLHVPSGQYSDEMNQAAETGADIHQHKPGRNSVIIARSRTFAAENNAFDIPFGMECIDAVQMTAQQVLNIPDGVKRIVVPVGSAMSLSGILIGMAIHNINIPVLGVKVGADPQDRLRKFAPESWDKMVSIIQAQLPYSKTAPDTQLQDLHIDPIYEAKCLPFLEPGDLLWIVGSRKNTARLNNQSHTENESQPGHGSHARASYPAMDTEMFDVYELNLDPDNVRKHNERNIAAIRSSLSHFGQRKPIVVQKQGLKVRAGNGTLIAARELGWDKIAAVVVDESDVDAMTFAIADNRTAELAEWDNTALNDQLDRLRGESIDLESFGWSKLDVGKLKLTRVDGSTRGRLSEKFMVPPFSVLDARKGYWRARKKEWNALGLDSWRGREHLRNTVTGEGTILGAMGSSQALAAPSSVFDPVLAELLVRWFTPPTGTILDPFAGGCVRGIVSGMLNRNYVGIDLSAKQVDTNRAQLASLVADTGDLSGEVEWRQGDSRKVLNGATFAPGSFDAMLSCPPYFDLERYSDDPEDISNMSWDAFLEAYREIIARCYTALKDGSFVSWVIGDLRDAKSRGYYRNLPGETVSAFLEAGFRYYNEAVLVTEHGSLILRASQVFESTRKLGRSHQNVLVFLKGDLDVALARLEEPGELEGAWSDALVEDTAVHKLSFSSKWLLNRVNCTLDGIRTGCHGACCSVTSFWPPSTGKGSCPHLAEDGCEFGEAKPLTCHLYPMKQNKGGTVVLHRGAVTGAICKGNAGTGPTVLEAIWESLVLLLGSRQADSLRAQVEAGDNPAVVNVSQAFIERLNLEHEWAESGAVPQPLTEELMPGRVR